MRKGEKKGEEKRGDTARRPTESEREIGSEETGERGGRESNIGRGEEREEGGAAGVWWRDKRAREMREKEREGGREREREREKTEREREKERERERERE